MRTHGHREENITHCSLSGAGTRGGRALGEVPNVDDGVMTPQTTVAHV